MSSSVRFVHPSRICLTPTWESPWVIPSQTRSDTRQFSKVSFFRVLKGKFHFFKFEWLIFFKTTWKCWGVSLGKQPPRWPCSGPDRPACWSDPQGRWEWHSMGSIQIRIDKFKNNLIMNQPGKYLVWWLPWPAVASSGNDMSHHSRRKSLEAKIQE